MVITTLNDYQLSAGHFVTYGQKPTYNQTFYEAMGLAAEAGELVGHLAKAIRDDDYPKSGLSEEKDELIKKELGDILWFVAMLADSMGYTLQDIANANLEKLADRRGRGILQGSGDDR